MLRHFKDILQDRKGGVQTRAAIDAALCSGACLAIVTAVLYFAAAMLGLALMAKSSSVAVFWPASGLAAGLLIGVGRHGRLPVAVGVFSATIAANVMSGRGIELAIAFGLCNACEALLFGWMVASLLKPPAFFDDFLATLAFLLAAAVSTALMAFCAALSIFALSASAVPFFRVWEDWWASDLVGIVTCAPFLIVLTREFLNPSWRRDLIHGPLTLFVTIVIASSTFLLQLDQNQWSPLPVAALFPILLWLGARCHPVYLTAGVFSATLIIVIATILDRGVFGATNIPLDDRVLAARMTLIAIAICSLITMALVAQQRATADELRRNQQRFENLAASAPGLIYSFRVDAEGRRTIPYASAAVERILGMAATEVAIDGGAPFVRIHPDDLPLVERSVEDSLRTLKPWQSEFRYRHPGLGEIWLEGHSSPVMEIDGGVIWHGFMQDITQRKAAEAHVELLMGEVNHRANNLLAVVQAVAYHTAREAPKEAFVDVLDKRIQALAISHELLVTSHWDGVMLASLVERQLAHLGPLLERRIAIDGPPIELIAAAAQTIGMALHELSTNAIKYGALSSETGRIDISWRCADRFVMKWVESAGPPVIRPNRHGFGHRLLVRMAMHQLEAKVQLGYHPEGLSWEIDAPLNRTVRV